MIRGFTERYFLTDYSYILENQFYLINGLGYCFKHSLFGIFSVNSSEKVLFPQYEGPSTHIFRTSFFCMFIIYSKREIGLQLNFSPDIFWAKGNSKLYVFISSQIQLCLKLKQQSLGKYVRKNCRIVTGFIPRSFVHIGETYFSMIFVSDKKQNVFNDDM